MLEQIPVFNHKRLFIEHIVSRLAYTLTHVDTNLNTHHSCGPVGANLPLLLSRNTPASQHKVGSNPKGHLL